MGWNARCRAMPTTTVVDSHARITKGPNGALFIIWIADLFPVRRSCACASQPAPDVAYCRSHAVADRTETSSTYARPGCVLRAWRDRASGRPATAACRSHAATSSWNVTPKLAVVWKPKPLASGFDARDAHAAIVGDARRRLQVAATQQDGELLATEAPEIIERPAQLPNRSSPLPSAPSRR